MKKIKPFLRGIILGACVCYVINLFEYVDYSDPFKVFIAVLWSAIIVFALIVVRLD